MAKTAAPEQFEFSSVASLRVFLNQFKTTDLDAVYFKSPNGDTLDYLSIVWEESALEDGSIVTNMRIKV